MAGTTEKAQRAEIYKTIWCIANDLRGRVGGKKQRVSAMLGAFFGHFFGLGSGGTKQ